MDFTTTHYISELHLNKLLSKNATPPAKNKIIITHRWQNNQVILTPNSFIIMTSIPSDIKLPPSDIKQTIDKTVGYVLKNGKSFEERLLTNNKNDKFTFIKQDNEYYPYYKWKLDSLKKTQELTEPFTEDQLQDEENIRIAKPPDLPFLIDLPIISQRDLDVIKATALYIAQNGKQKIPKLLQHETKLNNRAQFEFLNESHSLHGLFQKYIQQYKTVIALYKNSPEENDEEYHLLRQLIQSPRGEYDILTQAYNRAQYIKQNKVIEKREQEESKARQLHYALIDWQDFSLIAEVDFNAIDAVKELSIPLKRDDLIKRSLDARSKDIELPKVAAAAAAAVVATTTPEVINTKDQVQTQDEKQSSSEADNGTPVPSAPPIKGMKIRAAGTSRLKKPLETNTTMTTKNTIKCPITGKLIPENEFDTHIKTLLRDPRYKKEQENYIRKNFSYASNITTDQVYENIKRFVKKRTNIEDENLTKKKKVHK